MGFSAPDRFVAENYLTAPEEWEDLWRDAAERLGLLRPTSDPDQLAWDLEDAAHKLVAGGR